MCHIRNEIQGSSVLRTKIHGVENNTGPGFRNRWMHINERAFNGATIANKRQNCNSSSLQTRYLVPRPGIQHIFA